MKAVNVVDDYLNKNLFNEASDIIKNIEWRLSNRSQKDHYGPMVCFWDGDIESVHMYKMENFLKQVLDKTEKTFNAKFLFNKIQVNGQTYGQDGLYHKDNLEDNHYTLVIYMTECKNKTLDETGGFFEVVLEDTTINIKPKVNRAILFKSALFHRGLAPEIKNGYFRVSIAIKLTMVKDEKYFVNNGKCGEI